MIRTIAGTGYIGLPLAHAFSLMQEDAFKFKKKISEVLKKVVIIITPEFQISNCNDRTRICHNKNRYIIKVR